MHPRIDHQRPSLPIEANEITRRHRPACWTRLTSWGVAGLPLIAAIAFGGIAVAPARGAEDATQGGQVEASYPLPMPLMPSVPGLDVVTVEGKQPVVMFLDKARTSLEAIQPTGNPSDLLGYLSTFHPESECAVTHGAPALERPCRWRAQWKRAPRPLDLLSYTELEMAGRSDLPGTFFLLDDREHRAPLVQTAGGSFRVRIDLRELASRIDVRRLAILEFIASTPGRSQIALATLSATAAAFTPLTRRTGMWLWDVHRAVHEAHAVIETCRTAGVTRLAVQLPDLGAADALWQQYVDLLAQLQSNGIEPAALDGAPEVIHDPAWLIEKLRRLQSRLPAALALTVQTDIEPYLLPGFFADEQGFELYVRTLKMVKEALRTPHRLSVVVPFWLTEHQLQNRNVLEHVLGIADDVVVMSYRTDLRELQSLAANTLRYADFFHVPVWLAIETTPLPLEHHIQLYRESRKELSNAFVDLDTHTLHFGAPPDTGRHAWFRIHHRSTVRPSRLTFAGQSREAVLRTVETLKEERAHSSLAGVFIHDFSGFLNLPGTTLP